MWGEAIKVAVVGFSVVFAGLWMLALGVKIMSMFCKVVERKTPDVKTASGVKEVAPVGS